MELQNNNDSDTQISLINETIKECDNHIGYNSTKTNTSNE